MGVKAGQQLPQIVKAPFCSTQLGICTGVLGAVCLSMCEVQDKKARMDAEYARLAAARVSTADPLAEASVSLSGQGIVGNSLSLSDLLKRAHVHYRRVSACQRACPWHGLLAEAGCLMEIALACPYAHATLSKPV